MSVAVMMGSIRIRNREVVAEGHEFEGWVWVADSGESAGFFDSDMN